MRIAWGSYQQYEGPYFLGTNKVRIRRDDPSFLRQAFAVVVSTEGGTYDAYNAYDRCRGSLGALQHCDAAGRQLQRMLGGILEFDTPNPFVVAERLERLNQHLAHVPLGASLTRAAGLGWVIVHDGRPAVDDLGLRRLYLGGSTGLRGQWTSAQRAHAIAAATALAGIFRDDEEFVAGQLEYACKGLVDFVFGSARELFGGAAAGAAVGAATTAMLQYAGYEGAMRAGYLSFAANLPDIARRMYERVAVSLSSMKPKDRCITLLRELTFGPNVTIYPGRYDKIRPELEARFGVDLPDFSRELREWKRTSDEPTRRFADPKEIQRVLVALGYDLGPRGVDGIIGPKTRRAIQEFQRSVGLEDDGIVGPKTARALADAEERRARPAAAPPTQAPPPATPTAPPSQATPKAAAVTAPKTAAPTPPKPAATAPGIKKARASGPTPSAKPAPKPARKSATKAPARKNTAANPKSANPKSANPKSANPKSANPKSAKPTAKRAGAKGGAARKRTRRG
jgi:hypothetical protein